MSDGEQEGSNMAEENVSIIQSADGLVADVRSMIEQTREGVAYAVSAGMTLLYWRIGKRIQTEVLEGRRADYGKKIVSTLSRQLVEEFGTGFAEKSLRRMVQFAEVFPDSEIVVSLIRQLSWTHILALIPLKDPLKREFYAEMCRVERWSVRTLRKKIDSMLYERTGLSKKPAELAKQELAALRDEDMLTPDLVFRDPYLLDFLGLKDTFSENDLEAAILRELESFLLEFGEGMAFLARQKRITVDNEDFYIDLLFYHRRLRCLVAIDLKLEKFKPAHVGQMEFYLRWLAKYEQHAHEKSPLGLILCSEKSDERIELLELDQKSIRVAEYLTELPPRDVLERKLREAIEIARARLEAKRAEGFEGAGG